MPEHILHGEEGSGRFNPTSYSPAAFLPVRERPTGLTRGTRARCALVSISGSYRTTDEGEHEVPA